MKIENIKDRCTGCMACANVCPTQCISCDFDAEGFYYPVIDHEKCLNCGKCEKFCHVLNAFVPDEKERLHRSFYGFSNDETVLKKSTSGGAFYHLAQGVLAQSGNVYGAYLDLKQHCLRHTNTDEIPLEQLMKSKYIESSMIDVLPSIQKDIAAGRKVLFCGAPCQVSGIKRNFPNEELLLTVDFICHGIPSARLFWEHVRNLIGERQLTQISFRSKDKGWADKKLLVETDTKKINTPYYLDPFYAGFMTYNAFLRRSCYDCQFREHHCSDITIADFWGYREVNPNMNTDKGISLLVAHTEKGLLALNSLSESFSLNEMENRYSDYAFQPRKYNVEMRKAFYCLYEKKGFKKAVKKTFMKGSWKKRLKYKVKRMIGRK